MGVSPLYITEGDPVGISPELVQMEEASLKQTSSQRPVFLLKNPFLHKYKFTEEISLSDFYSILGKVESGLYSVVVPSKIKNPNLEWGKPSAHSGGISFQILKEAIKAIQLYSGDLITLPLSKEWVIQSGQPKFTGHTEELAKSFRKKTFMLMYGKTWKVIPLTTHIPLKKVPTALKNIPWDHLLDAIQASKLFPEKIKVGYLGLNPHAGEGGKVGTEEEEILLPAMGEWKKSGVETIGPLSADSAFLQSPPDWDLCLSCYHDQGLIPFKILEGKRGINVTLGLPFMRVSPDHGTAYSIAGKGTVDSTSFKSCLEFFS